MKTVSIANRKGGVGKTSITANIAWEIQRKGYKVLLIDLDSQCDLTSVFEAHDPEKPNIYDVLTSDLKLKEAFCRKTPNLTIVQGAKELAEYETRWNHKQLKKKLNARDVKQFDLVLIDHPPGANNASKAGFLASDYVLIVIEPDSLCLKNLDQMLDYLSGIQEENNKLKVAGLVMNKIDNRRNITKTIFNQVSESYGEQLFADTIGIDTTVPNALFSNKAIREMPWRSRNVTRFRNVAKELLERVGM